jgi:hypothetical protein
MEELSQTDLKIVAGLDKKINYHKNMIKWYEDEKKYFYKKGGYDR